MVLRLLFARPPPPHLIPINKDSTSTASDVAHRSNVQSPSLQGRRVEELPIAHEGDVPIAQDNSASAFHVPMMDSIQ